MLYCSKDYLMALANENAQVRDIGRGKKPTVAMVWQCFHVNLDLLHVGSRLNVAALQFKPRQTNHSILKRWHGHFHWNM